jgi:hypothetical protein
MWPWLRARKFPKQADDHDDDHDLDESEAGLVNEGAVASSWHEGDNSQSVCCLVALSPCVEAARSG